MAEENKAKAKASKKAKPTAEQQKAKVAAVELVRLRNNFYRDNYRRLVGVALFLVLLLIILGGTCFWLFTHQPQPKYFATNIRGGLIQIQPLSQPVVSTAELNNWASRAAMASFTLNYVQYKQQMAAAIDTYFTKDGGQEYQNALVSSNDLDYIRVGKFIVTAEPSGAPRILAQGVVPRGQYQGRFAWQVQIPINITAQNERFSRPSKLLVDLFIVRTSTLVDKTATSIDATLGIGIAELVAAAPKRAT